jgi:hypothetical protein
MTVTVGPGALRDIKPVDGGRTLAACDCYSPHAGRPEKRPGGCGYMANIPEPADAR